VKYAARLYGSILTTVSLPLAFHSFFRRATGGEYGVGLIRKLALLFRMRRNTTRIPSGSHFLEHLVMATTILEIPASESGCVVECGSYKGASATNLSLACALVGRDLEVFDSFEGLPPPSQRDQAHLVPDRSQVHTYGEGEWRGSEAEVRANITRYGDISIVALHPGFFHQTLPHFEKRCVVGFLDVDLLDSLKTCLKHIWPLLCDGGYLFTHEARHFAISAHFFDGDWWSENLGCDAPGLIGAGSGLGLVPSGKGFRSDLAYTIKNPPTGGFRTSPQRTQSK
jgi:O-methyltransferase